MSRAHAHAQDGWAGYPSIECVEIDTAVCLRPTVDGDDRHLAGFIISHDAADLPHRCEGYVTVDAHIQRERWEMSGSLKGGDLTLTPSINCARDPYDGFHGYVRDGKWVPA